MRYQRAAPSPNVNINSHCGPVHGLEGDCHIALGIVFCHYVRAGFGSAPDQAKPAERAAICQGLQSSSLPTVLLSVLYNETQRLVGPSSLIMALAS